MVSPQDFGQRHADRDNLQPEEHLLRVRHQPAELSGSPDNVYHPGIGGAYGRAHGDPAIGLQSGRESRYPRQLQLCGVYTA